MGSAGTQGKLVGIEKQQEKKSRGDNIVWKISHYHISMCGRRSKNLSLQTKRVWKRNVTEVSHYISIHSAPHAIVFLIYFDVILIVHMQKECIYLGESFTHYKLMPINTDKDSPTKSDESSNSKSREHLQTQGNGLWDLKRLSYPAVWFSYCLALILERTAQSLPFLKGCANQHNLQYATGLVV